MAKQVNDPLGILNKDTKNVVSNNNDPLGIKKKVETQQPKPSTSGSVPSTGGSTQSQQNKPLINTSIPKPDLNPRAYGEKFEKGQRVAKPTTPTQVAIQQNKVKPIEAAGLVSKTPQEFEQNKEYYETLNIQKNLKSKGYDVPITGVLDDKTKLSLNLERDKTKLDQKEAFESADFYNRVDNLVGKDKSFYSEENLVPYLTEKFSKQGYQFEESGIGNYVTASYIPDGQTEIRRIEIPVNEEGVSMLRDFMKQTKLTETEQNVVTDNAFYETENGQKFIKGSGYWESLSPDEQKKYDEQYQNKMVELMASNPYKYGQNLINEDYYKNIVDSRTLDLKVDYQRYSELASELTKYAPDSEEYKSLYSQAKNLEKSITSRAKSLQEIQKNYQKATGIYYAEKEGKGNFLGTIMGGIGKGIASAEKQILSAAPGVLTSFFSTDEIVDPVTKSKLEYLGYTDEKIKDYAVKELNRTILPKVEEGIVNVITGGSTSKEYLSSEKRGELEKTIGFLTESVGAAVSGGGNKALTSLAFFSMAKNGIEDEMRGTDFDDLSENQKLLVSVPYALTIGALEELGFKFSTGVAKSPLVNNVVKNTIARAFKELPENATSEVIEESIKQSLGKTLIDAGIKVVGGALVEGATEGLQKLDEIAIKNVANAVTEKDYFKNVPDLTTTEGLMQAAGQALEDAKYGFYGGLIMSGGATALETVNNKFDEKKSNEEFSVFYDTLLDDKLFDIATSEINRKLEQGEIDQQTAESQLNALNTSKEVAMSIPEDMSMTNKRKSFNLINEKKKIESETEGKEKSLVQAKVNRLKEIDNLLTVIGNQPKEQETLLQPTEEAQQESKIPFESNSQEKFKRADVKSVNDATSLAVTQELADLGKEMDENNTEWKIGNIRDDVSGRLVVDVVLPDGRTFLMYKSTGTGSGAESKGEWTPLPGFAENGWFIKTGFDPETGKSFSGSNVSSEKYNPKFNKYGSSKFKEIADYIKENESLIFSEESQQDINQETPQQNVNQENITGLPSDDQGGKTPIEAKPIETTSTTTTQTSGDVQAPTEEKVVEPIGISEQLPTNESVEENAYIEDFAKNIANQENITLNDLESELQKRKDINVLKKEKGEPIFSLKPYERAIEIFKEAEAKKQQPSSEQKIGKTDLLPGEEIITQKANEYESNQGTETKSIETDTKSTGKAKTTRLRQPKQTRTQKALKVDTTDIEDYVRKYFVGGGRMNVASAMQELFGNKQSKSIKNEYRSRIGLHKKDGPTIKRLAEMLWMENQEVFGDAITDQDWRNAIESVILSNNGTKNMIEDLLTKSEEAIMEQEAKYWEDNYGEDLSQQYDESSLVDAEGALDMMTDEEIMKLAEEIDMAEKELPQQEAPSPIKSIDQAISFLDNLESKLDKFGKESLGMNIPVAVLQSAIKVAKVSLQAGKAVSEAFNDAIESIKSSDFYKGLTDKDKSAVEQNVNDLFVGKKSFEDIVEKPSKEVKPSESKPAPEKEDEGKYRYQSQDWRAAQMSDEETKKKLLELAKYPVQNEQEMSDYVDDLIELLGEEGAIQEVTILPDIDTRKTAVMTEAGARIVMQSRADMEKALANQDTEAYEKAQNRHESGLKWIHNASTIKRKAGQLNAYTRKTYEKYPSVFLMSKQYEFDSSQTQLNQVIETYTDENGNTVRVTVQDAIDQTRENIQKQIGKIVDDNLKDEQIEKLLKENEELRKKAGQIQTSKQDEKIIKAKKNLSDAIAKFKNASKGGQASASFIGLNQEQIEAIGEMIKAYIELGYATTSKIVNKAFNDVKDYFPSITKEHIRTIGREIDDFQSMHDKELYEKEVQKVKEGKVISAQDIRDLVKMQYQGQLPFARTLAESIVAKLGLDKDSAKDLADKIEAIILDKVQKAVESEMTRFAEKGNNPTTEELRKKRREGKLTPDEEFELNTRIEQAKNQREINQIMKLVRLGKLSDNNDFARAFEKKFGFRKLSTETKKQLDSIVERIFALEQDAQKEITKKINNGQEVTHKVNTIHRTQIAMLQKQYNTLLESQRKMNYAMVLKELVSALYVNMLSGPLTMVRAFIGGYGSGALGTATYLLSNINKPKSVIKGLVAGIESLPAAYARAIQSRKKGFDFFGESSLKGDYDTSSMGWYERTMLSGLSEAYNNKEWLKVGYKSIGQLLKVIHALGALDTFMNTVSGAVVGTIESDKRGELYNKELDSDFQDIASQEWNDYRNEVKKQVEKEILAGKTFDLDTEITRRIKQELGISGSRLNAKKTFITNRVQELRENALSHWFEKGVNLAKDASLMGTPDGFVGLAVSKLKPGLDIKADDDASLATLKFLLNGLFKFVRITGQLANKTFNNIPVLGMANALIGPGYNHATGEFDTNIIKGKLRSNPLLVKQRIANNILVTATTLVAMMLMFEDDEEEGWVLDENRPFDVRGFGVGGQGGKGKNERSYENYQNLSISFTKDKDGNWTNYVSIKLIPEIASIVATLASYSDYLKGDVDDKTKSYISRNPIKGTVFKALGDNAKILTESSFSSVGRIFKNIQQEDNFFDGLGVAGRQLIIDNTKPLINPTSFQAITKEITKGRAEKEARDWEYFVKNLYGLDAYLNDEKTDVFGNPYKVESDYSRFMKEMFGAGTKRSEENKQTVGLLYKFDKGANISKRLFNEMRSTAPKGFTVSGKGFFGRYTKKYQSNDDQIAVEAQDIQETKFRELVLGSYDYLNSLETKEELEKQLKELQTESVDYVKREIIKKYEGTKKITRIEE